MHFLSLWIIIKGPILICGISDHESLRNLYVLDWKRGSRILPGILTLTNLIFLNNRYFVLPVHNFLLWTIKIWSKFNWMVEASWDMSASQFLSTSQNDCWWSWSLWHQSRWGLLSNYNNTYLASLSLIFCFPNETSIK